MQVTFLFRPGQGVVALFGRHGYVRMCACDKNENKYYVHTATGSEWFDEDDLESACGEGTTQAIHRILNK